MRHRGLLLSNHLHRGFFFDDLLRCSSMSCRCRGCDGVPFVVLILVVIVLSHAIESILFDHLYDQFITGLDHSF
jgi:hypothetical protein